LILAIDVQYKEDTATVAGVLFSNWQSAEPHRCVVTPVSKILPYEPGAFYKRELPCIMALLKEVHEPLDVIVVDGFVSLGADQRKGLGMHLYESINKSAVVVGVAKQAFKDTPKEFELLRGESQKPIYVSAAGMSTTQAINHVASMHGKHRLPTMLKKVDQLCRGNIVSSDAGN